MNILFLTMSNLSELDTHSIYSDLMRKFRDEGHEVYIVAPRERRLGENTHLYDANGVHFLGVKTLNLQKTNVIEKGVGQVLVAPLLKNAIKKHLPKTHVDLILYSTPPITLMGVVKYLKKKNPKAVSYLMLKDIFPQNAVDIGMMSKTGIKSILYWHFRRQEKELYKVSDYIGCMSVANVAYVLKHNPEIPADRVEVAPNSIELIEKVLESGQEKAERYYMRKKYDLPTNKPIFIYGGNLGKPQGIPFLIECLNANSNRNDCHFVVIGNGTEFHKLEAWYERNKRENVTLMQHLPKEEYDTLVRSCDVGLIFLDHRFTIPNYPSRLLSYLENKMPVLCATDPNTDIGPIAEANGYGYWCESKNPADFTALVDKMLKSDIKQMGEKGYQFLCQNYLVENTYNAIIKHFE